MILNHTMENTNEAISWKSSLPWVHPGGTLLEAVSLLSLVVRISWITIGRGSMNLMFQQFPRDWWIIYFMNPVSFASSLNLQYRTFPFGRNCYTMLICSGSSLDCADPCFWAIMVKSVLTLFFTKLSHMGILKDKIQTLLLFSAMLKSLAVPQLSLSELIVSTPTTTIFAH